MSAQLELGKLVATPGALALLAADNVDAALLLARHRAGDWGELDAHDKAANDRALIEGDRILSSYRTRNGKVWIVTEWDRCLTTILLPEEY
jgi:hypothetical protein